MCPPYIVSILGVLVVTGYIEALAISAVQPQVAGYENNSIILATSYQSGSKMDWLQIRWNIVYPKPVHLVICTLLSEKLPNHRMFPENGYESRMTIDPKSGSLMVKHLKMEDSGTYNVSVLDTQVERWTLINVTVLSARTEAPVSSAVVEDSSDCSCNSSVPSSAWVVLGCRVSSIFITFLILLGIHFRSRKRPRCRRVKRSPSHCDHW
ncbi:hypothetical protein PRIEUP_LOCUS1589 [Pristimantis euphronides]